MAKNNDQVKTFNNPLIRFIAEKKYRWLRHLLFILVGLILAFKGDFGVSNDPRSPALLHAVILNDSITYLFIMGIMYCMLLFLIPRLLFRSKVFLFALSFFVALILIYLIVWWLENNLIEPVLPPHSQLQRIDLSFVAFIQIAAITSVLLGSVVGMAIFKKWINDIQRMNELQQVNLKTELEQLKSQVNPHFLFNTLNNLFVLMKTDTEKASQVLLGLSDLLRYQLYDSTKEKISLSKDIAFMKNLLALEKIRKNDFVFTINTSGNIEGQMMPPFLFIPFVENAIKHGASSIGQSYLTLDFGIADGKLYFIAENNKPAVKHDTIGGLGLSNIRRRLDLLYPGKHKLEIIDKPDKYIVHLILPL
ncbi:MAG: histidine kinase [Ferruginibacter sp.]